MLSISLLTISSNSSYMAFRISQIVAFVSPDLSDCLVFTHCVSPAPRLESFGVVVPAPVVPVAMVSLLSSAVGFFNSFGRWFRFVILHIIWRLLDVRRLGTERRKLAAWGNGCILPVPHQQN